MSKKQNYQFDFKLKLVELVVKQGYTAHSVCREYKVSAATFDFWCKQYHYHGAKGLEKPSVSKSFNTEEKLVILQDYQRSGLSLISIAAKYGIGNYSSIAQWKMKLDTLGYKSLEDSRGKHFRNSKTHTKMTKKSNIPGIKDSMTDLEKLRIENEYLRAENDYLKKLEALAQSKQAKKKKP